MTLDIPNSHQAIRIDAREHALFLDFDGTLAPLQDDPDAVTLPADGAAILRTLHHAFQGALVLISGRDVRDLSVRTPVEVWRAGGHGLEICRPGEAPNPAPAPIASDLRRMVAEIVDPIIGARIEEKGRVLAIHYRQNPDAETELLEPLITLAQRMPGYKAQHGKMVIELKPEGANKGLALTNLMQHAPFSGRLPIMFGDDTTDEDAMIAAERVGGFGVKVGEGKTGAKFRLADTDAVWTWLRRIVNEHA